MLLLRVQFCFLSILFIGVSTYFRRMMRDYRVYTCIQADLVLFVLFVSYTCTSAAVSFRAVCLLSSIPQNNNNNINHSFLRLLLSCMIMMMMIIR